MSSEVIGIVSTGLVMLARFVVATLVYIRRINGLPAPHAMISRSITIAVAIGFALIARE